MGKEGLMMAEPHVAMRHELIKTRLPGTDHCLEKNLHWVEWSESGILTRAQLEMGEFCFTEGLRPCVPVIGVYSSNEGVEMVGLLHGSRLGFVHPDESRKLYGQWWELARQGYLPGCYIVLINSEYHGPSGWFSDRRGAVEVITVGLRRDLDPEAAAKIQVVDVKPGCMARGVDVDAAMGVMIGLDNSGQVGVSVWRSWHEEEVFYGVVGDDGWLKV